MLPSLSLLQLFKLGLAWYILLHLFTFNLCLHSESACLTAHTEWVVSPVYSDSVIGAFRSVTFKVIRMFGLLFDMFVIIIYLLYSFFVFHSFSAFSSFNWVLYMIWLLLLSWHINYTSFLLFQVVVLKFTVCMYKYSKVTFKEHYSTSRLVQVLHNTIVSIPPSCPQNIAAIHFTNVYAIITQYIIPIGPLNKL